MASALYTRDILRLAASIPHQHRLTDADGSADLRSPTCGSRLGVDVRLAPDGRIADLGIEAQACALGQASAALMGNHAVGRSLRELDEATEALRTYLSLPEAAPEALFWPGIGIFAPARAYPARHPSILLAFEAVRAATRHALAGKGSLQPDESPRQGVAA